MMKLISVLLFLLLSKVALSQTNYINWQSQPNIKWEQIETKRFKIVYPKYLEEKARYTLDLLEHYAPMVSDSYKIKPKKLFLVLRPEVADPNGFVTLAPRRTEWYNFTNISPHVGATEWLQTLAIHEYRHVVQYDYLNQGYTKWGYYLFGETGLSFLINIIMPGWYFEGDAVWAETMLSDGGRGRSPRFSARLKALVTSGQIPDYDALLAGDYTQNLPNLYVYGYYLITNAYNKFGKNVWKDIAKYAADRPWNPFAVYSGFYYVTKKSFQDFYNETLLELKKKWGRYPVKNGKKKRELFKDQASPLVDGGKLYYFQKSLDSYWGLYRKNKLIKELNVSPKFSKLDMKKGKLVYAQVIPHSRFNFKSYSDLFVYDLKKKTNTQITKNQRLYYPQFSPNGSKIAAIGFNEDDENILYILDNNGEIESEHDLKIHDLSFAEVTWINNNEVAAILSQSDGKKFLAKFDPLSEDIANLTTPTRNNIFHLRTNGNILVFEADYQGAVQIFAYNTKTKLVKKCTSEYIGAFTPYISNKIYYAQETDNGRRIAKTNLSCQKVTERNLFTGGRYLSKGPSDFYHKSKLKPLRGLKNISSKKVKQQKHSEFSGLSSPHSWSFIGNRGFQLEGTFTNNLNTLGFNTYMGISSEEQKPFIGATLFFGKYYPIYSLTVERAERKEELEDDGDTSWIETKTQLGIALPYIYSKNLWSSVSVLSLSSSIIQIGGNDLVDEESLSDNTLIANTVGLSTNYYKNLTSRQLQPRYGFDFNIDYTDLKTEDQAKINFLMQTELNFYLPSFTQNQGMKLGFTLEKRPNVEYLYKMQEDYVPLTGYTFSRGYSYDFTAEFRKTSFEYINPLFYPNDGFGRWIYFPRLYSKFFFDSTAVFNEELEPRTLNSMGLELYFESYTFRKFPLTYGLRFLQKEKDESQHGEVFLATNIFI